MSKKRWKVTRVIAIEAVVMSDRKWLANFLFDEALSEARYAWMAYFDHTPADEMFNVGSKHRITEDRWEVVDEGSFGVKEVSK